jgi:hypothetical protein
LGKEGRKDGRKEGRKEGRKDMRGSLETELWSDRDRRGWFVAR